jgi:uncharacterized protein (TIGR02284 family)
MHERRHTRHWARKREASVLLHDVRAPRRRCAHPGESGAIRGKGCAAESWFVRCFGTRRSLDQEKTMMNTVNPVTRSFHDLRPSHRRAAVAMLAELRALCAAGEAGYREAATRVQGHPNLRQLFLQFAEERREFADELSEMLERMGHSNPTTVKLSADLHRLWIDLRSVLEGADPTMLIAECERGEHAALTKYEAALKQPLSLDVEQLLIDHVAALREARIGLDKMRHPW